MKQAKKDMGGRGGERVRQTPKTWGQQEGLSPQGPERGRMDEPH